MRRKRRRFSAEFKARVVRAALRYSRLVAGLLLLSCIFVSLHAEEDDRGKIKLLPASRFEGLHASKSLQCALTANKVILNAEGRESHIVLDVTTGKEEDISHDVVHRTPVQVLDGRYVYVCYFRFGDRDEETLSDSVVFECYDLEAEQWIRKVQIPVAVRWHPRFERTIECKGSEAFLWQEVSDTWPAVAYPDANAQRVRDHEASLFHSFLRVDMDTGKVIDRFTYCSGIAETPNTRILCYDPYRRALLKHNVDTGELLCSDIEGKTQKVFDVSAYFKNDENLRAKAFQDEILLFGDSRYLLLDPEYTVKDVVDSRSYVTSINVMGREKIDRFSPGVYYVNRKDSAAVVVNFKSKKQPLTVLGYVYGDAPPIRDGVLYWRSRWGDLMRVSAPDFEVEVVKERYLYAVDIEESTFSGNFLFLPACDGEKLRVHSATSGKLKEALDYSDNPIVEFAVAMDSVQKVAVLLSDGVVQVINSVTLEVEREVLLKPLAHHEFLEWKLVFSAQQFIALLHYKTEGHVDGYRFDHRGKTLQRFTKDMWIFPRSGCATDYLMSDADRTAVIPFETEIDLDGRWFYSFFAGGCFWSCLMEQNKSIVLTKRDLSTGKNTVHELEWFENAGQILKDPYDEHICYVKPYVVFGHRGEDGVSVYFSNTETGETKKQLIAGSKGPWHLLRCTTGSEQGPDHALQQERLLYL
ncbi:MAG: hypothetical protein U5N86_13710 [Planctomycetota bacterium]|nr:hypothetical protein [Planctomycetota bacterium]